MFIVVESGKCCGQSFLGFLWASSENELAATTAMLQAVGLCGRGEKTSPVSIFIARTFGLHRTERSEPGKVSRTHPQRHILWQPATLTSPAPGPHGDQGS